MPKVSNLLTPFTIGDLELKNRIVMAPLTRGRCDETSGIPTDINVTYYTQRASAGLIISEATSISKQAHGWAGAPGIYTPEQIDGWSKV
jgi:N-ethylmaleimide reductase